TYCYPFCAWGNANSVITDKSADCMGAMSTNLVGLIRTRKPLHLIKPVVVMIENSARTIASIFGLYRLMCVEGTCIYAPNSDTCAIVAHSPGFWRFHSSDIPLDSHRSTGKAVT